MCIYPLTQENLENLKNFKYKSTNESILYNKFMSPCLNKLINYIPKNIAPNLITIISLCFNILAAIISYLDGGFDFSHKLKRSTCFIIGSFQLFYQLADNIDGKQARRTGNSTPFGMLMDHGCDVFTNIFTAFNLSKLFLVGNEDFFSFSVFFGLILGFYIMTLEEYKVGEMHFPKINGTDEGNFIVFLMGIFIGIIGQDWLEFCINEKFHFTIGKLLGFILFLFSLSCVFNLFLHTYQKKGFKEMMKIFLDMLPIYGVFIVPCIFIGLQLDFYQDNKGLILTNISLLFARITIDLQIKILTSQPLSCNIMYNFINISFIFCLFLDAYIVMLYALILLILVQSIELIIFIVRRVKQITDFLKIRIFCINPVSTV
jgi:ethanolaminephosphotransferase